MAYFLVRILVNALAVAITVALLPGIQLAPDVDNRLITILVYLVLGGLFGLINAFIRPLVLFVTGSLPLTASKRSFAYGRTGEKRPVLQPFKDRRAA